MQTFSKREAGNYGVDSSEPSDTAIAVQPLLRTEHAILEQTTAYPRSAPAEVTAVLMTMPPGADTGLHRHDAPFFAYVLEGEFTVSYNDRGARICQTGDSLMEAIGTPHNGRHTGDIPARILATFMGVAGATVGESLE